MVHSCRQRAVPMAMPGETATPVRASRPSIDSRGRGCFAGPSISAIPSLGESLRGHGAGQPIADARRAGGFWRRAADRLIIKLPARRLHAHPSSPEPKARLPPFETHPPQRRAPGMPHSFTWLIVLAGVLLVDVGRAAAADPQPRKRVAAVVTA